MADIRMRCTETKKAELARCIQLRKPEFINSKSQGYSELFTEYMNKYIEDTQKIERQLKKVIKKELEHLKKDGYTHIRWKDTGSIQTLEEYALYALDECIQYYFKYLDKCIEDYEEPYPPLEFYEKNPNLDIEYLMIVNDEIFVEKQFTDSEGYLDYDMVSESTGLPYSKFCEDDDNE